MFYIKQCINFTLNNNCSYNIHYILINFLAKLISFSKNTKRVNYLLIIKTISKNLILWYLLLHIMYIIGTKKTNKMLKFDWKHYKLEAFLHYNKALYSASLELVPFLSNFQTLIIPSHICKFVQAVDYNRTPAFWTHSNNG